MDGERLNGHATLPELDFSMTDLLTEQAPAVMEIAPLIEALDMLNDTHECDASQSEASCSQYGGQMMTVARANIR